jgi:hypothetical protein
MLGAKGTTIQLTNCCKTYISGEEYLRRCKSVTLSNWRRILGNNTKAIRLINKLCPNGKICRIRLWNTNKFQKKHFTYGYTKHRRREQAVIIQSQLSWKLRKLGKNHTTTMRNIANAFPSVNHESLGEMLDSSVEPRTASFLKSRHEHSYMILQTNAGDATILKPKWGGLQGDAAMAQEFSATYDALMENWLRKKKKKG